MTDTDSEKINLTVTEDDIQLNMEEYDKIQQQIRQVAIKKNYAYGIKSLELYGGLSIVVRMSDKMRRIESLTGKGLNRIDDESVEDSLADIINYATYMIMTIRGKLRK